MGKNNNQPIHYNDCGNRIRGLDKALIMAKQLKEIQSGND